MRPHYHHNHLHLLALPAYYAEQGLRNGMVSVRPVHLPHSTDAGLLLWAQQEISLDCCPALSSSRVAAERTPANAGSATLSADV